MSEQKMGRELIAAMARAYGGASQFGPHDVGRALLGRVTNAGGAWADLVRPTPQSAHAPEAPASRAVRAVARAAAYELVAEDASSAEHEECCVAILAAYDAARIARASRV